MQRVQYFVASSLDGFIATDDDSLDWLLSQAIDDDGPMSYASFIGGVGTIVMGATTFDWVVTHESARDPEWRWPYDVPCFLFSHRKTVGAPVGADIRLVQGEVASHLAAIRGAAGERHIWLVGGGDLVGQFTDLDALDDVLVSIAPVTLGSGRPLLTRRLELELQAVDRNSAFACLRYTVAGH